MSEHMKKQQEEAWALMRQMLQDDLLELQAEAYKLNEDFGEGRCEIFLSVKKANNGEPIAIEGVGVGLVDALFHGLKSRFSGEYPSLESLSFSSFNMTGLMSSGHEAHTDAEAKIELGIKNSYGREFRFEATSRSIGQACINATMRGVEYFINAERTFKTMYRARKHYESEGRTDLVSKYTDLMSMMVANTSYSEVIERLKKEL
jgi:hypothetical protein